MSIALTVYKALMHPRLKHAPAAWRLRRRCRQLLAGTVHRTAYLRGHAWVRPGNVIADTLLATGEYEPEMAVIIDAFVRSGFSFVDVGANIGLHTLAAGFARANGPQRIVAFEPEPSTFELLTKNVASNALDAIECHAMAVGSTDGRVSLHVSDGWNQGAHSLSMREETTRQVSVSIGRLDTFFVTGDHEPKDMFLVKIDVEGWEPGVLEGGPGWLSSAATCAVLVEIFPEMLATSGRSPADITHALNRCGFRERFIVEDPAASDHSDRPHPYWNMLFVKGTAATRVAESLRGCLRQPDARDVVPPL